MYMIDLAAAKLYGVDDGHKLAGKFDIGMTCSPVSGCTKGGLMWPFVSSLAGLREWMATMITVGMVAGFVLGPLAGIALGWIEGYNKRDRRWRHLPPHERVTTLDDWGEFAGYMTAGFAVGILAGPIVCMFVGMLIPPLGFIAGVAGAIFLIEYRRRH